MIGTAVGQAGRSTTTIMFTFPIRRSRQHAATILQDLRLQTVRGELAGLEVSAARGESVDRGELVSPAALEVQGESAALEKLAGVLGQDHLLGHTILLKPGRTRAQSRISRRQALFPTIQDWETRTEIWRKTSPYEMRMRQHSQPIGWQPTVPQLRIAPTIRSEDLATDLMLEVDATAHSVVINPVEELKPRATGGDRVSAEAGSAGAVEVVAAAAEVVVEEEAAAVAAAVDDDASWRFGPPRGPSQSEAVKRNREQNRD